MQAEKTDPVEVGNSEAAAFVDPRAVTWRHVNEGDVGKDVCKMYVTVGEETEEVICVNVNAGEGEEQWAVPYEELNTAFTLFPTYATLTSRLQTRFHKDVCDSSIMNLTDRKLLGVLREKHKIGHLGGCQPIKLVLLRQLAVVLAAVGYDFGDFFQGLEVIRVLGKSLNVVHFNNDAMMLGLCFSASPPGTPRQNGTMIGDSVPL